jgi:helix-turn-helix protein
VSIVYETRPSDSPYVQSVTRGRTVSAASSIRPAESHWHMVFVWQHGEARPLLVGPWSGAGAVSWTEDAELLWIRFELGTFMPRLPVKRFLDTETMLPGAGGRSFWLDGSAWRFPDYENTEAFIGRLVRGGALVRDPAGGAALRGRPQELSARTMRHRFLQTTGLTQGRIRQVERAQRAAALLRGGASIPDAIYEAGYFDQSHMTRSLKRWVGRTPSRIAARDNAG